MSRPTGSARDRSVTVSSVGGRPRKSSLTPKPRKTITSNGRKSTGSSVPAMDRNTMMIVEANEISAYLQKEYEFSRKESDRTEHAEEMAVKVLNKKLNISCTWSLAKFKERLNKMRKLMYKDDGDTLAGDAVFFDPNDTWEREEQANSAFTPPSTSHKTNNNNVTSTPVTQTEINFHSVVPDVIDVTNNKNKAVAERPLSPQEKTNRSLNNVGSRGLGSTQGSVPELPADSEFILTPPSPDILTYGVLPEKYQTHTSNKEDAYQVSPAKQLKGYEEVESQSEAGDKLSVQNGSSDSHAQTLATECPSCSVINICKNMAESLSARLNAKVNEPEMTMIDKILCNCESIKTSVINILSAYTAAKGRSSHVVNSSSIHLVSSLELLVSHTTYFLSSFETAQSLLLKEVTQTITQLVKSMTSHVVTLLKGCDEQQDELVHDSASDLIECLFEVVKLCGELSLATETLPVFLQRENFEQLTSFESPEQSDALHPKCSIEIRQSLISGCDNYVENSLKDSLKTVRNCEASIEHHLQDVHITQQCHEEILKHTEIIIATTKILILKFQEVQAETSAHCKDDSEEKTGNYYQSYFERCQLILSAVSNLSGSVSLLTQAGQTAISEPEAGNLRKVLRCAEMVSRATTRLLGQDSGNRSSSYDPNLSAASDSPADSTSRYLELHSVLSEMQTEELNKAGSDVKRSVQSLVQIVRKGLTDEPDSGKVRRMLPVTPSTGKGLVRAQSARVRSATERDRVSRRLSMIDSNKSQEF